jgi:hypothetical protein
VEGAMGGIGDRLLCAWKVHGVLILSLFRW